MEKDMTEEKQKLENDRRNNEEVQNTKMKEHITELEDRHQRYNLKLMGIKEKSGVESETWEES